MDDFDEDLEQLLLGGAELGAVADLLRNGYWRPQPPSPSLVPTPPVPVGPPATCSLPLPGLGPVMA